MSIVIFKKKKQSGLWNAKELNKRIKILASNLRI